MPHKHHKPAFQRQLQSFQTRDQELKSRGYIPADIFTTTITSQTKHESILNASANNYNCSCGNRAAEVAIEVSNSRYRTPVPLKDCGDPNLGYIKWGAQNMLPVVIKKLAQSQYSTASILDYITSLLCGSGAELRYHYVTVNPTTGDPQEKSCKWELAGPMLRQRIATLRSRLQEEQSQQSAPASPSSATAPVSGGSPSATATVPEGFPSGSNAILSYRTKRSNAPSSTSLPLSLTFSDPQTVGTTQSLLDEAIQDLYQWEYSNAEWQHLIANSTDLDVLLRQWALDQSYFNIAHLRLTLEQGLPPKDTGGLWRTAQTSAPVPDGSSSGSTLPLPKIIAIDYISTDCTRMEQQSEDLTIHHTYYSERFRYEGTLRDQKEIVAYPSLPPQCRMKRMNQIIADYGKTTPQKRPQVVLPIYIPSFDSPYYPVAPWWSIFSSMLFNLAASITTDAVTKRNNSGMFSYLIYLNMNWFEKYCADHHAETDEERDALKHEYLARIGEFLRDKTNNGRIAALESLTAENEKGIIKSIEIQEIPQVNSKGSLEDMELVGNALAFAFTVHNSLIGSFGKSQKSSSGTQQREQTELKTLQLSPQQRLFCNAFDFILRWNRFDPHAHMHIKHYTLTTLDASKTGMTEAPM